MTVDDDQGATEIPDDLARAVGKELAIRRLVARGGFASVYEAWDERLKRTVAIKTLRHDVLRSHTTVHRFQREAETVARLRHPNIVPLYSIGETDDVVFLVMPLIEGRNLADAMKAEGAFSLQETCRIMREAASALEEAHRAGILHRDIKPENIMLDGPARRVVVMDFGISKSTNPDDIGLTTAGVMMGTPRYMSPEQLVGAQDVDARTDQYSLALVGYELLAGSRQDRAHAAGHVALKRLTEPPRSLSDLRADVSADVSAVFARALSISADDRFSSIGQFAAALSEAERRPSHLAVRRPQVGRRLAPAHSRRFRPVDRRRATALAAGLVLIAPAVFAYRQFVHQKAPTSHVVAVMPFGSANRDLATVQRELTSTLARNLEIVGSLRIVRPEGESDSSMVSAVRAAELGRRAGARLALTGDLLPSGMDSVRLRLTLLDVATGAPLGEFESADDRSRSASLTDEVTVRALQIIARHTPVAATLQSTIPKTSLGALRAYLRGERFYRRAQWDSALTAYGAAVALDSSLALGWSRLALVEALSEGRMPSRGAPAAARSVQLNRGLSARDSVLIVVTHTILLGMQDGFTSALLCEAHFSCGQGEVAARKPIEALWGGAVGLSAGAFAVTPGVWGKFNDDAELTFLKAFMEDRVLEAIRPAMRVVLQDKGYKRAMELDPGFTPPYEAELRHAFEVGRREDGLGALRALEPLIDPSDSVALASTQLVIALLDTAAHDSADVQKALRGADIPVLEAALVRLRPVNDPRESTVLILRELVTRPITESERAIRGIEPRPDLSQGGRFSRSEISRLTAEQAREVYTRELAVELGERGHIRESLEGLRDSRRELEGDPSPLRSFAARLRIPSVVAGPNVGLKDAEPWVLPALTRDTAAARRLVARVGHARASDMDNNPSLMRDIPRMEAALAREAVWASERRKYETLVARTVMALARGDSASAADIVADLADTVCVDCRWVSLTKAQLLKHVGRYDEALNALRNVPARELGPRPRVPYAWQYVAPVAVLIRLERASLLEKVASSDAMMLEARRDFEYVRDIWENGDAEVQTYVRAAREGVARLRPRTGGN